MPAQTLANIRAVSYALGGLSVEQLVEDSLRVFMFRAPQDIIAEQEESWDWDEPGEQARLQEAKAIAEDCEQKAVRNGCTVAIAEDVWPVFRAEVAKLRPFWG